MSLGLRLKIARNAVGMTQLDLARILGISRPTVSEWESGLKIPRRINILAWAMATGSDAAWLDPSYEPWTGQAAGDAYTPPDSNRQPAVLATASALATFKRSGVA